MGRSSSSDTRFLEQKNGKWRVSVSVPRRLQSKLGTKLKRSLKTDSLVLANRLKWPVIAELKAQFQESDQGSRDPLIAEALELSSRRINSEGEDDEMVELAISLRAEEIGGDPIGEEEDPEGGPSYIYDDGRQRLAGQFARLARGEAIPLSLYHDDFLKQAILKARTKGDSVRAVKFLEQWCASRRVEPTIQAMTGKRAARFMDDLSEVTGLQHPVTLNKYLCRLSTYWKFLIKRKHVEANPWTGMRIAVPETPFDEEERAFTDEEVLRLLGGGASEAMMDLMRIGALTGARIDPIVDLHVRDCVDGLFTFKRQKRERKPRCVPIHPELAAIIERRIAGKSPDSDVFPEWPAPRKVGSVRERSFKASNAFTAYRRAVGVAHIIPGKRRSLVNFHSFRRWFVTKAERADQPESIIAVVVGHKRQSMTLGRYSAGPLMDQARRCVEAVKLPNGNL